MAGVLLIAGGLIGYGIRHGLDPRPVTIAGPPAALPEWIRRAWNSPPCGPSMDGESTS